MPTIGGIEPLMHKYNASTRYVKALYREDNPGSIAFARAYSKVGAITDDDFNTIKRGLLKVMEEWKQDIFVVMLNNEDVRSNPRHPTL